MAKEQDDVSVRSVLAMIEDMRDLEETAARLCIQIRALAKLHGIDSAPRELQSSN